MRKYLLAVVAVVVLLGSARPASADIIYGEDNFIGFQGFAGVLTFSTGGGADGTNYLDFCPENAGAAVNPGGTPAACGTSPTDSPEGTGLLRSGSVGGVFAVAPYTTIGGTTGEILDFTDNSVDPAPYTYIPVGSPTSIANFLAFDGSTYAYTLTQLDEQTCVTTATQLCTGPFKLTKVGDNSITVALSGFVDVAVGGGDILKTILTLSAQFAGTDLVAFALAAASPEGVRSSAWSGELRGVSEVPEPSTILMLGFGSAVLFAVAHRRRKASRA